MADETSYQRPNEAFKIFVPNLNGNASEEEVRAFFAPCGEIVDFCLRRNDRGAFAFIGFANAAAFNAALGKSGQSIAGSPVDIKEKGDANKVFVSNLSGQTTESDVRAFFAPCGEIVDFCLRTNERGAFAFIGFSNNAAYNAAINMSGKELNGNVIGVRTKDDRPFRGGFRGRGGRGGFRPQNDYYQGGRGGGYGGYRGGRGGRGY